MLRSSRSVSPVCASEIRPGDWKSNERDHWTFRNYVVLVEMYDGFTKPSTVELNISPRGFKFMIQFFIQIDDSPKGSCSLASKLATKVGEVLTEELESYFIGNFVCLRVKIEVKTPLVRDINFVEDQVQITRVQ